MILDYYFAEGWQGKWYKPSRLAISTQGMQMKRLFLITLLVLSSVPAYAEWRMVGSNDDTTLYADPETIHRKGNLVKVWELLDFKTSQTDVVNGKAYLSSKIQKEFDCAEERGRTIAFGFHSGHMGEGGLVAWDPSADGKWEAIFPASLSKALLKIVCSMP